MVYTGFREYETWTTNGVLHRVGACPMNRKGRYEDSVKILEPGKTALAANLKAIRTLT